MPAPLDELPVSRSAEGRCSSARVSHFKLVIAYSEGMLRLSRAAFLSNAASFLIFAGMIAAAVPASGGYAPPVSQEEIQQSIQQHARQAQAYLRANQPEPAANEFRAILALDPNNTDAHANLGVLLFFR